MDKIINREPSFYRFNTHSGNMVYFSHQKDVSDPDFIDLDIKDVIAKIDELVDAYTATFNTIQELAIELTEVRKKYDTELLALESKIQACTCTSSPEKEE